MKIEICLPGKRFSDKFVISLIRLLGYFSEKRYQFLLNFGEGAEVCRVRDIIVSKSATSKVPFCGEEYDYILWIDSDQVFTPEDFEALREADKDIIAASIRTTSMDYACGWWKGNKVIRIKNMDVYDEPVEVDYVGFGFTLIKKGVYESIEYAWHRHENTENGEYMSEDLSFMTRVREKGFKVFVHPHVHVGHLKEVVL